MDPTSDDDAMPRPLPIGLADPLNVPNPLFTGMLTPEDKPSRSPPRRQTRRDSTRRNTMSPAKPLSTPATEFSSQLSDPLLDSPIRSFCRSKGLSDMAQRCGVLEDFGQGSFMDFDTSAHSQTFSTSMAPSVNFTALPRAPPVNLPAPQFPGAIPSKNESEGSPPYQPSPPGAVTSIKKKPAARGKEKANGGKGLRHFSYLVMSKVEEQGTTTYQQVSDELVKEIESTGTGKEGSNIKRRVYDALNVLRAIGIISKHKKSIKWEGFPAHSAQALDELQGHKRRVLARIAQKKDNYQDILKQFSAYQFVALRNRYLPLVPEDKKVAIPFILATSPSGSEIDCEMAENRSEYCISFQNPFKLYTEVQLLEMMQLAPNGEVMDPAAMVSPGQQPPPMHISPSSITMHNPAEPRPSPAPLQFYPDGPSS